MNDLFINFPLAYVVKLLFDFRISLLKHIKGNPEVAIIFLLGVHMNVIIDEIIERLLA